MLRHAERLLCLAALVFLSLGLLGIGRYRLFQSRARSVYAAGSAAAPVSIPAAGPALRLAGRLRIPRLGLSVMVVDGEESAALAVAAAHLSSTPPVGAPGNAVIAAHRDTAFWPLRHIRIGDRLLFDSPHARAAFHVASIRIVRPSETSVLGGRPDRATLTLITCYPFRFVGSAPLRFVVQAR